MSISTTSSRGSAKLPATVQLTAENTAIVLDSTADFPEGPSRFPNWRIVPLYVRFGAESHRDYVDIGPEQFYARLRTAEELPTTSQPTPADFLSAYEELSAFDRVLSLQLSSKISGTFESAGRAAAESGGRVRVIDTGTASAAITILALAVQRRLTRGTSDEEVDELVARFKRESEIGRPRTGDRHRHGLGRDHDPRTRRAATADPGDVGRGGGRARRQVQARVRDREAAYG